MQTLPRYILTDHSNSIVGKATGNGSLISLKLSSTQKINEPRLKYINTELANYTILLMVHLKLPTSPNCIVI